MSEWSADQYLKFKKQRTQPAIDLADRIKGYSPKRVLDIGCGPGNSSSVLKKVFPDAEVIGIDNSENMVRSASESYPDIEFKLCDAYFELGTMGKFDVIFSNACLQWIPNHEIFIPKMFEALNDGGVIAVQVPMNGDETFLKISNEVVENKKWGFGEVEKNGTLTPEEYFDILSSCTDKFDIWQTVYYHNMPSVQAIFEWVKGTRLRPYLNALNEEGAKELEKEIVEKASQVYKVQKNNEIIFKFRRFFFTAVK